MISRALAGTISPMLSPRSTGSHLAIPQVIKVFATKHPPDYWYPWRRGWTESATGSGVIVGPRQILTNAHVVAHATFLQVQKIADSEKAVAKTIAVCHDTDLALIEVDDEQFLRGTAPVEVGELCNLRDKVIVAGFPMGGEQLSITEGVVSRIEIQTYAHSLRRLLAITIDAAINPGNSGGPVFKEGKVVGLAFQKISGAEAMGAMVPAPFIKRFLDGVAGGRDTRVPACGIAEQSAENPALRRWLGLRPDEGGVLISQVGYGSSAWGCLQVGDVLLAIDGLPVGSNGTVSYRGRFRTDYWAVLGDHLIGDRIELLVLRQGQRLRLEMELKVARQLVPPPRYQAPTYFVYGGLVFQALSLDHLRLWDADDWINKAPPFFTTLYLFGAPTETQREVVVLTKALSDAINVGYEEFPPTVISTVNGKVPRDMADFVEIIESSKVQVQIRTCAEHLIVLDPEQAAAANPEILERYDVGRDRSADLLRAPASAIRGGAALVD